MSNEKTPLPKIAFFDIDNTLYDWSSKSWDHESLKAIKLLKKKGCKVMFATSRPYDSAKKFGIFDLGIKWDGYITSAGSVARVGHHYVYKALMEPRILRKFLKETDRLGITCEVITPLRRYQTRPSTKDVDAYRDFLGETFPGIRQYHDEQTTGLLMMASSEHDEELQSLVPEVEWLRFHEYGVDVLPTSRNKGPTIKKVLDYLGIDKEAAIHFGDDRSDLSAKGYVKTFVCMGDAKDEVREQADYLADTVSDHGVSKALRSLGYI